LKSYNNRGKILDERRQAVAAFSTSYMGSRWPEAQILSLGPRPGNLAAGQQPSVLFSDNSAHHTFSQIVTAAGNQPRACPHFSNNLPIDAAPPPITPRHPTYAPVQLLPRTENSIIASKKAPLGKKSQVRCIDNRLRNATIPLILTRGQGQRSNACQKVL